MIGKRNKEKVIDRLGRALGEIPELAQHHTLDSIDFEKWHRNTEVAIEKSFGKKSRNVRDFQRIHYHSPLVSLSGKDDDGDRQSYFEGLKSAAAVLESMIDEVEEYWPDNDRSAVAKDDRGGAPSTREVFVIHGRDEGPGRRWRDSSNNWNSNP